MSASSSRASRSRLAGWRAVVAGLVFTPVCAAWAAAPQWLALQTPTFGVVSQLSEADTRRWAVEFEQFVESMHALYSVDNVGLPPLTIVLFKQPKDFAPYRLQTASGQAKVVGVFGRSDTWSVIGLAGRNNFGQTDRIIKHEAVHWFASASESEMPLWFNEGLAEALGTFRVVDGKGRWGEPIPEHVGYLRYAGLMPMEQLLRASQDEALHGAENKYYPQAWAFVHYLIFGNGGVERSKLSAFLLQSRTTDTDTAFTAAFGKPYEEVTNDLERYLERGSYGYAETALDAAGEEMTVRPASAASVEFSLARLAATGGNLELARKHVDRVIELAPSSPVGYEMRAYVALQLEDMEGFESATDRAIELGSKDALTYRLKADHLLATQSGERPWDESLGVDTARTAADLYERALALKPRFKDAHPGLVTALLNVDTYTEADRKTIADARLRFPTDGLLAVAEAAMEHEGGNLRDAALLVRRARKEPFNVPSRFRPAISDLHTRWTREWIAADLATFAEDGRFEESRALIAEQLADPDVAGPLRSGLERMNVQLPWFEKLHAAEQADRAGDRRTVRALLEEVRDDPTAPENARRLARQILEQNGWGAAN